MTKSSTLGVLALLFAASDVQAIKTAFRPPEGTVPWHKNITDSTWVKPDWDVNYFVPNFGVDKDIKSTQKHLAASEDKLKHKLFATFKKTDPHPVDYFVPNFGPDEFDVKLTHSNIEEAETELGHKLYQDWKKPGDPHPVDYFVPNFGVDQDIKDSHKNLRDTEDKLQHKLYQDWKKPGPGHPKDYFVPDFGLDEDIVSTQANIASQEAIHGPWVPKQDENGHWIVPQAAKANSYKYESEGKPVSNPTPAPAPAVDFIPELGFVQLESDPICSSAEPGCNQPVPKSHPVDYFVPNFGVDHDIRDLQRHLAAAEKYYNHTMYEGWSKSEPHPTDYPVPNFGLDEDIVNVQSIVAAQEKIHGKWTPVQDDNGYWIVPQAAKAGSYSYRGDKASAPAAPAAAAPAPAPAAEFTIPELF